MSKKIIIFRMVEYQYLTNTVWFIETIYCSKLLQLFITEQIR